MFLKTILAIKYLYAISNSRNNLRESFDNFSLLKKKFMYAFLGKDSPDFNDNQKLI